MAVDYYALSEQQIRRRCSRDLRVSQDYACCSIQGLVHSSVTQPRVYCSRTAEHTEQGLVATDIYLICYLFLFISFSFLFLLFPGFRLTGRILHVRDSCIRQLRSQDANIYGDVEVRSAITLLQVLIFARLFGCAFDIHNGNTSFWYNLFWVLEVLPCYQVRGLGRFRPNLPILVPPLRVYRYDMTWTRHVRDGSVYYLIASPGEAPDQKDRGQEGLPVVPGVGTRISIYS
jgi:hypothetical protein